MTVKGRKMQLEPAEIEQIENASHATCIGNSGALKLDNNGVLTVPEGTIYYIYQPVIPKGLKVNLKAGAKLIGFDHDISFWKQVGPIPEVGNGDEAVEVVEMTVDLSNWAIDISGNTV